MPNTENGSDFEFLCMQENVLKLSYFTNVVVTDIEELI